MRSSGHRRTDSEGRWICNELLEQVFHYISSPQDRAAVSEVSKQWYLVEGRTRKRVAVKFPYVVLPSSLTRRFKNPKRLIIKGKPRVSEFGLLVHNWGGYAGPWVSELVAAKARYGSFSSLSSIQLRRAIVSDEALIELSEAFPLLEVLKIKKCSGFSTAGLQSITQKCRQLRVLCLKETVVEDAGHDWLQQLQSSPLERLNMCLTGLEAKLLELAALVQSCKSLSSIKTGEVHASKEEVQRLKRLLCDSGGLKEFFVLYQGPDNCMLELPRSLTYLGGEFPVPLDAALSSQLRKLDLMLNIGLNVNDQLEVIKCCPNLEELKVRNVIGDDGLSVISTCCSKLRSIRIESLEDQSGFISHKGLVSLAFSCINLQKVAIYASDLNNSALQAFGKSCPNMQDFRIAVLDSPKPLSEYPLDTGAKALLQGCKRLRSLGLYLKMGGLSDDGLAELGKLAGSLKWILLGCVGYSDRGFIDFASGCQSLQKLEMRHCPFTEIGIAAGVNRMTKLKFIWSQGWKQVVTDNLRNLGQAWNVEFLPAVKETEVQFVAYKSLCGPRSDSPEGVLQLVA